VEAFLLTKRPGSCAEVPTPDVVGCGSSPPV